MRLEGSIRLSSRLSFSFPSNNPVTGPPELDREAQLRIEWDLRISRAERAHGKCLLTVYKRGRQPTRVIGSKRNIFKEYNDVSSR